MIAAIAFAGWLVAAPTVIEHVRVEVGDGNVIDRATVVLDNGHIVSVARDDGAATGAGNAATPTGTPAAVATPRNSDNRKSNQTAATNASHVDGTGKTLTPGLVEARSLLGISEVEEEESTHDFQLGHGVPTPAFRTGEGFNPASLHIAVNRAAGITSAVLAPSGRVLHGTGGWVDLSGTWASRASAATPVAMFGSVGYGGAEGAGGARGGLWLLLREVLEDARFYQKNRAAFDRGDSRELILRPDHLAALGPVLDGSLPLVLEADRASDIVTALEFAAREKLRVIVSGGAEAWRVAPQLAAARVPVIFKPSAAQPGNFEQLGARDDTAALLHAAGVTVIVSAGSTSREVARLRQEAGLAVAYGLPRAAALATITRNPAQAFGKGQELGTVSVGKRANLVLWSGDPLEVRSVAEHVWIDGEPQSLDTRQLKLAKRYLNEP